MESPSRSTDTVNTSFTHSIASTMAKKLYTDLLYESLQTAVERRIIQYWTVDGCDVVIIAGREKTSVPVKEAGRFVTDLFRASGYAIVGDSAHVPA